MGRPVLSDEEVSAFRRRATEAAADLFAQQGYEAFSMRALAKQLGCSHATPYRYFASKEELFACVRADGFRRFGEALRAGTADIEDPADRLRALGRAYLGFAQSAPAAFAVIFEMGQTTAFPFVDEAALGAWSVLYGTIEDAVEAKVLAGEVALLAHTSWAGVHGVATLALAGKLTMGIEAASIVETMVEGFLRAHAGAAATAKKKRARSAKTRSKR